MPRRSSKQKAPANNRYILVRGRNVYSYSPQLAKRRDAEVVDGPYAAAALLKRGMTNHPLVVAHGEEARQWLAQFEADAAVTAEEVIDEVDAVIDTRKNRDTRPATLADADGTATHSLPQDDLLGDEFGEGV